MIDQLKSIGIEKGKPFNPDAKTTATLDIAAQDAKEWLAARYDAGFPPFWDGQSVDVPGGAGTGRSHAELLLRSRRLPASMRAVSPIPTPLSGSSASAPASFT